MFFIFLIISIALISTVVFLLYYYLIYKRKKYYKINDEKLPLLPQNNNQTIDIEELEILINDPKQHSIKFDNMENEDDLFNEIQKYCPIYDKFKQENISDDIIGEGGYGKVLIFKKGGGNIAVKKIKIQKNNYKNIGREILYLFYFSFTKKTTKLIKN
jgi:hypothetical protein